MNNLKVDEVDFYLKRLKMRFAKIDSLEYFLSYSGGTDNHLLYWFIKEYLHNDKIPRTGCVGCPYGSYKGNTSLELSLAFDGRKKFIKDFFKESYEVLGVKEEQYQLDIFDIINKVD